jgi:threonine synthase
LDVTTLAERYRARLPLEPGDRIVSLGEGSTPLVRAETLSRELGFELWLKLESMNPTGSFKDRGMTVAVSRALAQGAGAVICASTGNTAASAAAYAARAGMSAAILLPQGAVALGKLAQARANGARLLEVRGSFDQALRAASALAATGRHVLVNSLNPDRIEGQKTAAFEIAEELGRVPDVLALPYGGGGNTRAYARGFAEWDAGMPRFFAGAAAQRGETLASAIRIVDPAHRAEAEAAVRDSGGAVVALTDDEIVSAWRLLAEREGVFCEPASAAGLAAVQRLGASGTVVVVVTGHGLKDPDAVDRFAAPVVEVDPDAEAIAEGLA